MSESFIQIAGAAVDVNDPAAILTALKKMQVSLAIGGIRQSVRIDGEEVTFSAPNDARLAKLIETYERQVARSSGRRARYARRIRFA